MRRFHPSLTQLPKPPHPPTPFVHPRNSVRTLATCGYALGGDVNLIFFNTNLVIGGTF
jgi:hypothetical protein